MELKKKDEELRAAVATGPEAEAALAQARDEADQLQRQNEQLEDQLAAAQQAAEEAAEETAKAAPVEDTTVERAGVKSSGIDDIEEKRQNAIQNRRKAEVEAKAAAEEAAKAKLEEEARKAAEAA